MADAAVIDLGGEVARVQREFMLFRDEFLPAVIGGPVTDLQPDGMTDQHRDHFTATAGRLSDWRNAAAHLSDQLPLGPLAADEAPLDRGRFEPFLFQTATPGRVVRGGRVVWRTELFVPLDVVLRCPAFGGELPGAGDDPWDWFAARADAARRWLTGLPADTAPLADSLCLALPFLADLDPPFARLCLDRDTWRTLTRADRRLPSGEREKRLRFCDSNWFGHILNNALLHVLGTLANNHFGAVRAYLGHPQLRGSYTHLMPHYLFAVLVEKVAALRQMSAGPSPDPPASPAASVG